MSYVSAYHYSDAAPSPVESSVAKWVALLFAFALVNFAIGFAFGCRWEGMHNVYPW